MRDLCRFSMLPLPMSAPSIAPGRVPAQLKKQLSKSDTAQFGIGKVFSGISGNLSGFLG